jgi:hypothetical protein
MGFWDGVDLSFGECALSCVCMSVLFGPVDGYGLCSNRDLLDVLGSDAWPACVISWSKMVRRCFLGTRSRVEVRLGNIRFCSPVRVRLGSRTFWCASRTIGVAYLFSASLLVLGANRSAYLTPKRGGLFRPPKI